MGPPFPAERLKRRGAPCHTANVTAVPERTSSARIGVVIAAGALVATAVVVVVGPSLATSFTRTEPLEANQNRGAVLVGRAAMVEVVPPEATIVAAAPIGARPPTAVVDLPPPGAEQPADGEAAKQQVREALTTLFSGKNPREVRLTAVDDRSNVDAAMDAVRKQFPEASDSSEPELAELVFTDASSASFLFRLRYVGAPLLPARVGTARLVDGRWLITRSTLCDVMSAAGHACGPPAPLTPPPPG